MKFIHRVCTQELHFHQDGYNLTMVGEFVFSPGVLAEMTTEPIFFWQLIRNREYFVYLAKQGLTHSNEVYDVLNRYFLVKGQENGFISAMDCVFDLEKKNAQFQTSIDETLSFIHH